MIGNIDGLSKREQFAVTILSGLCSSGKISAESPEYLIELAVYITDTLIKELKKSSDPA